MDDREFWIGSYTGDRGAGRGIYRARQRADGCWSAPALAAEAESPSYLALHPHLDVLYAVSERESDAAVVAYDVLDDRQLRRTGTARVPAGPCHLAVHPSGRSLLSASYAAGTVNAIALDPGGRFTGAAGVVPGHGSGPRTDRQEGPHAHAVAIAPDGTVLSTDLGADLVRAHRLDPGTGALDPVADVQLPAGCGPRHLVVHDSGHVFVLTELARTVLVLRPGDGYTDLRVVGGSPATAGPVDDASLCAAIELSDDGRFVYTSTRGADLVTTHEVRAGGGEVRALTDLPSGGRWPRDLCVAGDRLHVAHERSHTIYSFRLDPRTGLPAPIGAVAEVPAPVCIIPAS